MANEPVRHRPNVLFNLIGVLLIVGGIGLTIYGLAYAVQIIRGFDPFRGDGPPVKVADAMALAFWGIIVFTIGRYFWRGARKRGLRDRFGRLLIIVAYVLVGIGLDTGVHNGVGLWSSRSADSGQSVLIHTVVTFLLWGIAASIVGTIGIKLANEKILAKASMKAEF
jgi:hypothetical protein